MSFFGLLLSVLLASSLLAQAQDLTIIHANVVDVATGQIKPDQTVVITGKRITKVGPTADPRPRRGRVVNASGQYLIPGLWDMHTHIYFDGAASAFCRCYGPTCGGWLPLERFRGCCIVFCCSLRYASLFY